MDKRNMIDFGYAHLFVKEARINSVTAAGTLAGTYDNYVNILSAQYTHSF
jgi:long-subunit fatty acid transport protein